MRIRSDQAQPPSMGSTAQRQSESSAGGSKTHVPSTPLKSLGIALTHLGGKALAPQRQQLKLSRALEKGDRAGADHYVGKMEQHHIEPTRKNERGYSDMQFERQMEGLNAARRDDFNRMLQEWTAPAGSAAHQPLDDLKRSFAAGMQDRASLVNNFDRLAATARTDNVAVNLMLNSTLWAALNAHDAMSPQTLKQMALNGLHMHRSHEAQGLSDPNYFANKQMVDQLLLGVDLALAERRGQNREAYAGLRDEAAQLHAAVRERTLARAETSPASSLTLRGQDDEIRPAAQQERLLPRLR